MDPRDPEPTEASVLNDHIEAMGTWPDDSLILGLNTGFELLNEVLNGLQPGLLVLAGPPSCGKTAYIKQLADQLVEHNHVHLLFVTYEQSPAELRNKSLARLGRVKLREFVGGKSDRMMESYPGGPEVPVRERLQAGVDAYKAYASRMTIVSGDSRTTINRLQALAAEAAEQSSNGHIVVVVESLQALAAVAPAEQVVSQDRVAWSCSVLRRLARDFDCPVIVSCNESRQAFRDNRMPTLEAFDECWGVEFSADVLGVFWSNQDVTRGYVRPVAMYILKNRHGELARLTMLYQPEIATFLEQEKKDLVYLDSLMSEAVG